MKKIFNVLVVLCAVFAVCALMSCKGPTGPATVSEWKASGDFLDVTAAKIALKDKIHWDDGKNYTPEDKVTYERVLVFKDNGTCEQYYSLKTKIKPEGETENVDFEIESVIAGEYTGDTSENTTADKKVEITWLEKLKDVDKTSDKWAVEDTTEAERKTPSKVDISGESLKMDSIPFTKQ